MYSKSYTKIVLIVVRMLVAIADDKSIHDMTTLTKLLPLRITTSQSSSDTALNTTTVPEGVRNPYMTITYGISEVFILATFVLYVFSKDKQRSHRPVLMCHLFSVFCAYLTIIVRRTADVPKGSALCVCLPVIHQFFFLASFLWLTVLAFHFWRRFRTLQTLVETESHFSSRTFFLQSLFTIGVSFSFCFVTLLLDWINTDPKPDVYGTCSINDFYLNLALFYGPIGLLILVNVLLCVLTILNIRRMKQHVADIKQHSNSTMFRLSFQLILIMGLQWGLCYISKIVSDHVGENQKYWDALDTLNGLQGIPVFLVYLTTMRKMKGGRSAVGSWREKLTKTFSSLSFEKPKESKSVNIPVIFRNP